MRRSVREATIGFSLLAALAGGFALWFWLTGVAFGQKVWTFRLSFADAAGLAPQSTVTFRGVAVGTVRQVKPQSGAVLVTVQINDANLLLPRPIIAQVRSGSLLGSISARAKGVDELIDGVAKESNNLFSKASVPFAILCATANRASSTFD